MGKLTQDKMSGLKTAFSFLSLFLGLISSSSVFYLEIHTIFYFTSGELMMVLIILICIVLGIILSYILIFLVKKKATIILRIISSLSISLGALIYLESIIGIYLVSLGFPSLFFLFMPLKYPTHELSVNPIDSSIKNSTEFQNPIKFSASVGAIMVLMMFRLVNDYTNWYYIVSGILLVISGIFWMIYLLKICFSQDHPQKQLIKTQSDWNEIPKGGKFIIFVQSIVAPFFVLFTPIIIINVPPMHLFEFDISYLWIMLFYLLALGLGYILSRILNVRLISSENNKLRAFLIITIISLSLTIISSYLLSLSFSYLSLIIYLLHLVSIAPFISLFYGFQRMFIRTVWIPIFQFLSALIAIFVFIAAWLVEYNDLTFTYSIILYVFVYSTMILMIFLTITLRRAKR